MRMTARLLVMLAVATPMLATSCKPTVVGRWSGLSGFGDLHGQTITEFKKEGQFTSTVVGQYRAHSVTGTVKGTWRLEPGQDKELLYLTIQQMSVGGVDVPNPAPGVEIPFEVSLERDKLTLRTTVPPYETITYYRVGR